VGAENKLRQEIDDSLSTMRATPEQLLATPGGMRMADALDHPELYKAYPELADMRVLGNAGATSAFKPADNIFELGTTGYKDLRSPLLHEVQHKIQEVERWGKGGSPKMFVPKNAGITPEATMQYKNLAGEVEARLVQDRLRMSKQHRGFADPVNQMESMKHPINNQTLFDVERSVPPPGSINQPMMVNKLRAKKPLTEKQFYSQYAQHVDLRNRGKATAQEVRDKIMSEGFQSSYPNAMPASRGGKPLSVLEAKYAPQAGDTVYLAPKGQWQQHPNGLAIAQGWKPAAHEVVTIDDPAKSMYQYYLDSFLKDQ
jgi:hypothetical protein